MTRGDGVPDGSDFLAPIAGDVPEADVREKLEAVGTPDCRSELEPGITSASGFDWGLQIPPQWGSRGVAESDNTRASNLASHANDESLGYPLRRVKILTPLPPMPVRRW